MTTFYTGQCVREKKTGEVWYVTHVFSGRLLACKGEERCFYHWEVEPISKDLEDALQARLEKQREYQRRWEEKKQRQTA